MAKKEYPTMKERKRMALYMSINLRVYKKMHEGRDEGKMYWVNKQCQIVQDKIDELNDVSKTDVELPSAGFFDRWSVM